MNEVCGNGQTAFARYLKVSLKKIYYTMSLEVYYSLIELCNSRPYIC